VPVTAEPLLLVHTKPLSALVVPCSMKTKTPAASAPEAKSTALAGEDPTT